MADQLPSLSSLIFGDLEGEVLAWARADPSASGSGASKRAIVTRNNSTTEEPKDVRPRLLDALLSLQDSYFAPMPLAGVSTYTEEDHRIFAHGQAVFAKANTTFARAVMYAALGAYEAGEMEMRDVLALLSQIARWSPKIERYIIFGWAAERLLAIEPRKLKHTRPDNPKWLKDFAVELVDLFRVQYRIPLIPPGGFSNPDPDKDCALKRVTHLLALHRLCPLATPTIGGPLKPGEVGQTLSMHTLYEWYRKRPRAEGDTTGRARSRKKKSN